jgi:CheY-like chemotaxis protein
MDLRDALRDAAESSRPMIDRARHKLEVLLPPRPIEVQGDAVRLGQVFTNLLNNAAKYSEDGGRIEMAASESDGGVVVTVRDSGVGIAAEHLPRVFEMFAQIDSSAARRHGGLGIGLALARRLAEMHGGRVQVASDGLGRGSTFTVWLPLTTVGAQDLQTPSAPALLDARRMMVVDDNQDSADSLGMLLRFLGAEVRVEHSGAAALASASAWRPAVILLDLGMPGMDGFEVARQLRADTAMAGVKLIALTGWSQDEDRQRTRDAGFDHHLIKPVDLNVLHTLLASLQGPELTRLQ